MTHPDEPVAQHWTQTRPNLVRLFEILLCLAIVGIVADVAITTLAGGPRTDADNARDSSAVFGAALWFYLLAKLKRWPRAWAFALLGVLVVFVTTLGASVARGLRDGSRERALAETLISSVEGFDAQVGTKLRAAKNDEFAFRRIFTPALLRAVQRAPDSALVAWHSAQLEVISPQTGTILPRCLAAARGQGFGPTKLSKEELASVTRASIRLFDAASREDTPPVTPDDEKARSLILIVYSKVDPHAIMDDPEKFAALPDSEQCRMYLDVNREMHALPSADAAAALRFMMNMKQTK